MREGGEKEQKEDIKVKDRENVLGKGGVGEWGVEVGARRKWDVGRGSCRHIGKVDLSASVSTRQFCARQPLVCVCVCVCVCVR